jgi:hypothetical protein
MGEKNSVPLNFLVFKIFDPNRDTKGCLIIEYVVTKVMIWGTATCWEPHG